jgi:hypothetical protein
MKKTILLLFICFLCKMAQCQWTTSGSNIYYNSGGVGIGTTAPGFPLDVSGAIHCTQALISDATQTGAIAGWFRGTSTYNANVVLQAGGGQAFWLTGAYGLLKIGSNGGVEPSSGAININLSGQVGIGTTNTAGYLLAVNGSAIFTKAVVKLNSNWPDYVFKKEYLLPSLKKVEEYITLNNRLPGMPSADSVQTNGVDLGSTQAKLLEKIEELTLYTIDLQKQVDQLKTANTELAATNKKLENFQRQLDELKTLIKK